MTSFVVSAFAVSPNSGLGVAADPAKLKVFRPFFAQLNLPYSVKRGEKVAIQALVFNYMEADQTVTVRLKESKKFRFVEKSGVPIKRASKAKLAAMNTRIVKVKGGGGSAAVFFPIVPTVMGSVPLEVEAIGSRGAGDRLRKRLLVEPEGFRVEGNLPVTIDLSKKASFKRVLEADIPTKDPGFVKGSVRTRVSLIGDVMAPVLMPTVSPWRTEMSTGAVSPPPPKPP
jgi:CD109 antigen